MISIRKGFRITEEGTYIFPILDVAWNKEVFVLTICGIAICITKR